MQIKGSNPRGYHRRRRRAGHAGFTSLELLMGLSVSLLIGLCLVALTSSAAQGWRVHGEDIAGKANRGRGGAYLERSARSAQEIGYVAPGTGAEPATLLIWYHDLYQQDGTVARDHMAQQAELLLLKHDRTAQQLRVYRPRSWVDMSALQRAAAATSIASAALVTRDVADAFTAADWVDQYAIVGRDGVQVTGAIFEVDRSTDRPTVTYRLELRRDGILSTHVGTIAVRGRQKTDNWTGNDLYERDRANASSLPTLNLAPCTDVTTGGGDGGGDDEDLGDLFDLFG